MKAHVFALCLSLCLGLPLPALAFASPFTDVQETSPYYDAILWAAETGVTNGTTASTFSPDAPCTRAQLAVFLWRAAGEPKPALAEQQFMDVTDPSAYYYGAVQWAAEKDMWGFGTFAPHAVCTRLDAVFFLWRAAGSPDMEGEFPFADVPFGDGDGHGQPLYRYADQAVLWAVENGVASGTTETTFSPGTPCTRGPDRHIPVSGRSGRDFREVGNDELQATKKGGGCLWQPPSFVKSVRVHDAPGRFQLTGNGTGWRPRYLIRSPAASLALISFTASL